VRRPFTPLVTNSEARRVVTNSGDCLLRGGGGGRSGGGRRQNAYTKGKRPSTVRRGRAGGGNSRGEAETVRRKDAPVSRSMGLCEGLTSGGASVGPSSRVAGECAEGVRGGEKVLWDVLYKEKKKEGRKSKRKIKWRQSKANSSIGSRA